MSVGTTVILNSLLLFSPEAELSNQLKQLEPNLMASQATQCNSNDVGAAFKTIQDIGLFAPNLAANLNPLSLIERVNSESSDPNRYIDYYFAPHYGWELSSFTGQTSVYADMNTYPHYQADSIYNVLEYTTEVTQDVPLPYMKRLAKVVFDYSPNCGDSAFPNLLLAEISPEDSSVATVEIGLSSNKAFPISQFSIPVWEDKGYVGEHTGHIYFGGDFSGSTLSLSKAAFVMDVESRQIAGRSKIDVNLPIGSLQIGDSNVMITPASGSLNSFTVEAAAQSSLGNIGNFITDTTPFNLPSNGDAQVYVRMTNTLGAVTAAEIDINVQNIGFDWGDLNGQMGNAVSDQLESLSDFGGGAIDVVTDAVKLLPEPSILSEITPAGVDTVTRINLNDVRINLGYDVLNTSVDAFKLGVDIEAEACLSYYINTPKFCGSFPLTYPCGFKKEVIAETCLSQDFDQSFNLK